MKTPSNLFARILRPSLLAAISLLTLPLSAEAKDKDRGRKDDHHHHDKDHRPDRTREIYLSHPRTGFSVTLGNGWRGRGYYYGPPNSSYFYERPGVVYYSKREYVPQGYFGNSERGSGDAAVQRALSRRGYYRGPIDGDVGPGTRRAIARYQEANGLRVTGSVNSTLLRSLGL